MSALNSVTTSKFEQAAWDAAKPLVGVLVWRWYDAHKDDTLFTFKKWVFSLSIKVEQCRPLLVTLFGEPGTL